MSEKTIHIDKDPELPEILRNAKRNHGGQTVPADFFAQFEQKMNVVIDADILLKEAEKKTQKPQIQWYKQSRTWMGLAASFVLIVVVGLAMHVDEIGHKISGTQHTNHFATIDEVFENVDSEEFIDTMEEGLLATTNDYELYEYYSEI